VNLKVYRTINGVTEYWESWTASGEAFIHSGKVGEPGETRRFPLAVPGQASLMLKEVEKAEAAGFTAWNHDKDAQIVIHYRFEPGGSVENHTRRVAIEDLLNECLRRTGLGYCDGGDIGLGAMNVFCEVIDAAIAERVIVKTLTEHNELVGAILAKRERIGGDDDYKVLWPKDFAGVFNLF
jgi:hypothetical protein